MFWKEKTSKELDETQKKVQEAQDKLSSIMQAINRETLVYEEKQKQVATIEANISEYKKNQEKVTREFEVYESTIESIKRKDNEKIAVLSSDIKALMIEKKQIEDKNNHIILSKQEKIQELDNTITDKSIYISKLSKDIAILEDTITWLNTKVKDIETSISQSKSVLLDINNKIDNNNIIIKWLEKDIKDNESQLEQHKSDIETAQNTVLSMENTSNIILKEIESNNILLDSIKNQIKITAKELEELQKEKEWYVQIKMQIMEAVQKNNRKEAFIRAKYEEAWLPYN